MKKYFKNKKLSDLLKEIKWFASFIVKKYPLILINIIRMRNIYRTRFNGKLLGFLPSESIGTCAIFAEQHLRYMRINNYNPKEDVILVSPSSPANSQLAKMVGREANVIADNKLYHIMLNGGMRYLRRIHKALPALRGGYTIHSAYRPNFTFTEEEIFYGYRLSERIGINADKPFVVIHNKDDVYYSKYRKIEKPWDKYRNSNFETLLKSTDFLKSKGFQVIRGGHYIDEITPLPYQTLNTLSPEEKDFMDIFIQWKCSFSINGTSGISDIPFLFQRTMLIHNCIGAIPMLDSGIILPKLLRFKKDKKILSVSDIIEKRHLQTHSENDEFYWEFIDVYNFRNIKDYEAHGIEIVDNDEDEILEAVKETILLAENKLNLSPEEASLQKRFRNLFPIGHAFRHFSGYISPNFLKKHPEIINYSL